MEINIKKIDLSPKEEELMSEEDHNARVLVTKKDKIIDVAVDKMLLSGFTIHVVSGENKQYPRVFTQKYKLANCNMRCKTEYLRLRNGEPATIYITHNTGVTLNAQIYCDDIERQFFTSNTSCKLEITPNFDLDFGLGIRITRMHIIIGQKRAHFIIPTIFTN